MIRSSRFIQMCVSAGVVAAACSVLPGETPTTTHPASEPTTRSSVVDAQLLARLEALDARTALVRDMTTRFRQEKHTPLMRKPMVSSGLIHVKGSVMRWDTTKPSASMMRIDDKEIRLYYPADKTLEIYRLDQQMARLAASPLPRLNILKEQFDFVEIPQSDMLPKSDPGRYLALRLSPRDATLRQHVREIRVLLDLKTACMSRMEMTDADDDLTILTFEDVKMNTGLDDKDLRLDAPAGAKVVRPLEAMEQDSGTPTPSQ